MAGHSKWATTKHKKAIIDGRRAKLFAKLIKNIEVAARMGGSDQEGNPTLFEAVYKANGYTVSLDGLKDVDGKPAYKVIITAASGAKLVNYYAQDSGLKIKYENPASGDTFYSDYQAKEGVLMPMAWTIKSPQIPVPLEAKVTSLEVNVPVIEGDIN